MEPSPLKKMPSQMYDTKTINNPLPQNAPGENDPIHPPTLLICLSVYLPISCISS